MSMILSVTIYYPNLTQALELAVLASDSAIHLLSKGSFRGLSPTLNGFGFVVRDVGVELHSMA